MPIKSFLDLIEFISSDDNVTLRGVFTYELVYNMFHAIWVTYYDSMCIVNSTQQQGIIERTANIHNVTLQHYNHYNYISAKLLPMHNVAIKNTEVFERGTGAQTHNAHMMRHQLVAHVHKYTLNDVSDAHAILYNDTWCINSILAHMDRGKFVFNPIVSDEPPLQPPRAPRPRQPP